MGLLGAIFAETLANVVVAGAEGYAQHQAEKQPARGRRKSAAEGCTPCAAMAMVDDARAAAGFGPPKPPPRKRRKPKVAGSPPGGARGANRPKTPPKPPAKRRQKRK